MCRTYVGRSVGMWVISPRILLLSAREGGAGGGAEGEAEGRAGGGVEGGAEGRVEGGAEGGGPDAAMPLTNPV